MDALLRLGERFVVVVFGPDLSPEPAPGVRGVRLPSADPRAREELVLILTDESTTALVAHRPPGRTGLVQVALTHHEATVAGLARTVVRRIPPRGPNNRALPDPVVTPPAQPQEALAEPAPRRAWTSPWRSLRIRRG